MTHLTPLAGATCMSCWDDVDSSNYVEYKATETADWAPSGFCETCVAYLLKAQWEIYTSALAKTTCKAEQRRLLKAGPPVNLKDATAFPTPDNGEVYSLWYMSDGLEHSAKLEGSLIGEERTKYWIEQTQFYAEEEPEDETVDESAEGTDATATTA
eukprot:CAMPEP_0184966628 /NCGR_PEP_ID=MMETSP1098-20130426/247_1 /TAXON_ID=89044 /ORGANISM="Spumella elongata, Strain CCAP 955/1" /LENGTH=155 /DNA_ID=CAMNT_0027487937 /DNA_START=25 /DNA_END=492 /DNA_ORIENTATION=+